MSAFVPYFTYRDAKAAMAFLESAFGFETVTAYDGEDGVLMHGEMRFGDAHLMLGSGEISPASQGDASAVGIYLPLDDVDAVYERAQAAGATVVWPPHDTEFGTRRVRLRDPEGFEWTFGTYRPGTASW